jgi:hypothetical protein
MPHAFDLARLLGVSDPVLDAYVKNFERSAHYPKHDIRLVGDVAQTVRARVRELGLDPVYSNGPELYYALTDLARRHDRFLARSLGIEDDTDAVRVLTAIAAAVTALPVPKSAWVIKGA